MMTMRLRRPPASPTAITGTARLGLPSLLPLLRRRFLRLRARLHPRLLRRPLVLRLLLARGDRGCWLWWWELLVLCSCEIGIIWGLASR